MASKSPKSAADKTRGPAARKSAADKLREQDANGTATGADAPKPAPKAKPAAKPAKPGLSREQLEKAAELKREGKTWNEIRQALKVSTRGSGSSGFFAQWAKAGIDAPPKAKTGRAAVKKPAKAATEPKPQAPAKPKRAARKSGKAHGPRTSNGKAAPVRTRRATPAERQRVPV